MDPALRDALLNHVRGEPYACKLGLRLVELDSGYAKVEMNTTEDLANVFGAVHGGAVFSLLDEAFQLAGNTHGTVGVALQMNVSYLASARAGDLLVAEAREFHRTKRTAHYEIRVSDGQGQLIAVCNALAYRKAEPLVFDS